MVFEIESLDESISEFKNLSKKSCFDFTKEKKLIEQIESIETDRDEIETLKEQIEKFEKHSSYKIAMGNRINELKKKLPKICPFCGAKMVDGKCVEE